MPSFDTLAPGAEPIAAYQPIFELGRGGMGTVHLARAVGAGGFERLVVVKRLKQDLVDFPEAVQRFLDEARQAALINHANVVGIHQIGRDSQGYFLVLDYVEGGSLDDLVKRASERGQKLPPSVILRIALDALAGLSAAHGATDPTGRTLNLLHRDVSPQNVLVGRDGVSRLADFGVAKSALASVQTDQRYVVGKLLYLPPEYLAHRPVGPTLDIYSLGVTLWAAFCGAEPWPGATEAELVARICQECIPTLSGVGVRIAPQIEDLVMRACDPEPKLRFQSARAMADEIEVMARETGWVASHADVAALVEELIGADLARRRERTASIVAALPRPDTPSERTFRSVPPVAPVDEATTRKVGRTAKTDGIEVPVTRSRTPVLVSVAAIAVAGAALFLFGGRGSRSEESARTGDPVRPEASVSHGPANQVVGQEPPGAVPSSVAGARGATASVAVPSAAEAQAVSPADLPLDESRASSAAVPARPRGVPPKALRARADSKAAAAPTAAAPPVVTPVASSPSPQAPDSISKANPYR